MSLDTLPLFASWKQLRGEGPPCLSGQEAGLFFPDQCLAPDDLIIAFSTLYCVCVFMCHMHVFLFLCMHMCACGGQRQIWSIFLECSLSHFLRVGLSLNMDSTSWAGLAGLSARGHFCLPGTGIVSACHHI